MTPEKIYKYSRRRLYFAAIGALTMHLGVGAVQVWPSPAIPLLKPKHFSSLQNSLIGSLANLAPGPILSMVGIDIFGRKPTLFIIWLTIMSCWTILCISEDLYAILIATFISGCGLSASYLTVGIYISEIADVDVRVPLNGLCTIFLSTGQMVIYIIGPLLSFRMLSFLCLAISGIFGLFYFFLPESPYYYISKGEEEKARTTLIWLRADETNDKIEKELSEIMYNVEEEKKSRVGISTICSSSAVLKEFGSAFFILFIYSFCGQGPFGVYLNTIYEEAKLPYNSVYVIVGLSVFALLAGFPTPFVVKKFGEKAVFILCSFSCSIGLFMLSIYFYLLDGGYDVSSFTIVPVIGGYMLMIFVSLGLSGLIWAVVSDLFPISVKALASGVCGLYSTLITFVAIEIFGLLKDAYGFGPTFLGFAVTLFISTFGLFFFPNLHNMTLQEIQDYFEGRQKIKEVVNEIKPARNEKV